MIPVPQSGGYQTLALHRVLLQDQIRTGAFRKVIMETVKKGDVVVDLGAGTGILSLFACQAGARKVYAIEVGHIIEVAKRIAESNAMNDRIVFIRQRSEGVELPEKADVLVSDCISYFGLGAMIPAMCDAKARFLKAGGHMIPAQIKLFIAPVEATLPYYWHLNFWQSNIYGVDLSPAQNPADNNLYVTMLKPDNLIVKEPQVIHVLDFYGPRLPDAFSSSVVFDIEETRFMHGFCGWFDVKLSETVSISTSPWRLPTCWQMVFFPIEQAVMVEKGNKVGVELKFTRKSDERIDWDWKVTVINGDGQVNSVFEHSTLKSFP